MKFSIAKGGRWRYFVNVVIPGVGFICELNLDHVNIRMARRQIPSDGYGPVNATVGQNHNRKTATIASCQNAAYRGCEVPLFIVSKDGDRKASGHRLSRLGGMGGTKWFNALE